MKYCPQCKKSWLEEFSFCPIDASPLTTSLPDPFVGKIINDKFEILSKIGFSSSGSVYKSKHNHLDEWRVLKLLNPIENDESNKELRKRVSKVQNLRSEKTARIFDIDKFEDRYVIIEEFIDGDSLENLLRSRGSFPAEQVISILHQICLSLCEAHQQGIYHLNLKPSNILVDRSSNDNRAIVKVSDYAKGLILKGQTRANLDLNDYYLYPEPVTDSRLDDKKDIFSLGLLVLQMVTGAEAIIKTHMKSSTSQEWETKLSSTLSGVQMVSGLRKLIVQMLSFEPAGRPEISEILHTIQLIPLNTPTHTDSNSSKPSAKEEIFRKAHPLNKSEVAIPPVENKIPKPETRISHETPTESVYIHEEPKAKKKKQNRLKSILLLSFSSVAGLLIVLLLSKGRTLVSAANKLQLESDFLSLFLITCMAFLVLLYLYSFMRGRVDEESGRKFNPVVKVDKQSIVSLKDTWKERAKEKEVIMKRREQKALNKNQKKSLRDRLKSIKLSLHRPSLQTSLYTIALDTTDKQKMGWKEIISIIKPDFRQPQTQASLFHYIKERDSEGSEQIQISSEVLELLAKQPRITGLNLISSIFADFSELAEDVKKSRRRRMITAAFSASAHTVIILGLIFGLLIRSSHPKRENIQAQQISYLVEPPPIFYEKGENKDGGGGGGGGKREPAPPSPGRIPKTTRVQLVPPTPKVQPMTSPDTLLAEQSVVVPLDIPQDITLSIGDITAPPEPVKPASGPGADGGIGSGRGTGIGPGRGAGVGPGSGGGIGGGEGGGVGSGRGPYIAGYGGVRNPVPIYSPPPPYSDEGRRAKIEGVVILQIIVKKDGSVDGVKVVRGLGYGLDQAAVQTVATKWKFQPGTLNGQPVDVFATVEVTFRLL